MRTPQSSYLGALVVFEAVIASAKHTHEVLGALERRHLHHARAARASPAEPGLIQEEPKLKKRDRCEFPSDAGLYAVTPGSQNGGWAMSPDQPCKPGSYCPIACPSGQMMAQWDPSATSYPSMNGGLYCDEDGNVQKPYPNSPYCMTGNTNIGVTDKTGQGIAFCQTVLPGNEAMLIPTSVDGWAQLAVPTTEYWLGTAAHFYVNPPGQAAEEVCLWGTNSGNIGNWSPFVAGANTVANGETFIKLGWNPEYIDPSCAYSNQLPDWGVAIECDGEGCNGLPCAFDPSQNQINQLVGQQSDGAGGASFCVVTVPQGVSANFVITGGSGGSSNSSGSGGSSSSSAAPSSSPSPTPTPTPTPSSSSAAPSSTTSESFSTSSSSSASPSSSSFAWSQSSKSWAGFLQNSTSILPTASGFLSSLAPTAVPTSGSGSGSSSPSPITPAASATATGAACQNRIAIMASALTTLAAIMAFLL